MRANIGQFVSGKFVVPSLFMGTQGMGDFVSGWFAIPQNPVGMSGLGVFVPGRYALPQNPVMDASGLSGLGCGSACSCQQRGMGDLQIGSFDVTTWWNALPTAAQWILPGLAGFLLVYGLKKPTHDYHGRRLS